MPMVPGAATFELTALLVLMLSWLEFKKDYNKRVYFITDIRAIYAGKSRKGEWIFTDFPLSHLLKVKRSPVVKDLIMKFRSTRGTKTLKFPYLSDFAPAVKCLKPSADVAQA
jgi:hypothetical protein